MVARGLSFWTATNDGSSSCWGLSASILHVVACSSSPVTGRPSPEDRARPLSLERIRTPPSTNRTCHRYRLPAMSVPVLAAAVATRPPPA